MPSGNRAGRLKWACRRGMKELDVLLEAFIEREADALEQGRWPEFEAFLDEEDDLIWHWVLVPDDCTRYRELIDALLRRA